MTVSSAPSWAIEFRSLSKAFNGKVVNDGVSLQIEKGSIHAIIGENGAGKSTAMKMLYGTYHPDSGDVFVHGKLWAGRSKPWSSPADAIQAGIGMVHQHFMLSGPQTVLENIVLGVESFSQGFASLPRFVRNLLGPIDRQAVRAELTKLSAQLGLQVDWDAKIEDVSVGVQQRIEILKLLYRNADILILDEPTAVLTPQEIEELFLNLEKLCRLGKTVVIITHKLKEVFRAAKRVTVLRAGKVVGEREIGQTSIEELATLMVGRKVALTDPLMAELHSAEGQQQARGNGGLGLPSGTDSRPLLELKGVTLRKSKKASPVLSDVDLTVKAGEIVGICGVEGNGQSDLIEVILHSKEFSGESGRFSGEVKVLGSNGALLSTRAIKALGVGVIPDDRIRSGLLSACTLTENFLLGLHRSKKYEKFGILSFHPLNSRLDEVLEEFDVRPRLKSALAGVLSGGNQQKLVIARELNENPKLIVAAQPTRGVDVGAIEFIHHRLLEARSRGCGILLISSELDEILALSDRILVMYRGRMVAQFARGGVSEKELGLKMGGVV